MKYPATRIKRVKLYRYLGIIFFMNRLLLLLFFFFPVKSIGQNDTAKWVRAFPITDYIKDINDSVKVVQLHLPEGIAIAEKQAGLLKGVYRDKHSDTMLVGTGRCNLIKGDYYYFTINNKKSGILPKEGDLLFTMVDKAAVYHGNFIKLASYFIGLQNVHEKPFYDRYAIFSQWKKSNEGTLIDSMVADIHFTADYFLKNNPDMNVKVKGGKYEGKMVLNTMLVCGKKDVTDFLEYMIARPRLYAGHEWKISEIFATWLSEGAPTVIKPLAPKGE
jgi:hypothetical protein